MHIGKKFLPIRKKDGKAMSTLEKEFNRIVLHFLDALNNHNE